RIGTTPQILAGTIVKAALETRGDLSLFFVVFAPHEKQMFEDAVAAHPDIPSGAVKVVQGDITCGRGKSHDATAIINAANMEIAWGGGLSGAIAKAVGFANANHVQGVAHGQMKLFNDELLEIIIGEK